MVSRAEIAAGRAFVTLYLKARDFYAPLATARGTLLAFGRSVTAFGLIVHGVTLETQRFGAAISSLGRSMTIAGGVIISTAAAMASGLLAAVAQFATFGETLQKMSERTGIGVRALSELSYAAEVAGTNITELELGIRNMQNQIAAKDDFGLRGLPPEEQLAILADRFQTLATAEERTAFAQDMFGRSGTKMLPLLAGGSAGIKQLREEAVRFGRAVTEQDARTAERLKDAWQSLVRAAYGLMFTVGSAFGDNIIRALKYTTELVSATSKWIGENRQLVKSMALAIAGLATFGAATAVAGSALRVAGAAISIIAGAVGKMTAVASIAIPLLQAMAWAGPYIMAAAGSVGAFASGAVSAVMSTGVLAAAMSGLGAVVSSLVSVVLTPLGVSIGIIAAGAVALMAVVVAATAAAAAAAYAFWKLTDPFAALAPLVKTTVINLQKIMGLLVGGDFEGAANAMIDGFKEAIIQSVRAIFDMVRTTLERLPAFIAGMLSKTGGFMESVWRVVRKAFTDLVPVMVAAMRLMYSLTSDVFRQLPALATYSAGLIVKEFAIAWTGLNNFLAKSLAETLTRIGVSLVGLGPRLMAGMMSGDVTGFRNALNGLVLSAMIGSTGALSGFIGGISGKTAPAFKLSPDTQAAYKTLMDMLAKGGAAGSSGIGGGQQGQSQQARSLSGAFVTYSATALAASGRGGAVDRMAREAEMRRKLAEKHLDEMRGHRREMKRIADGLRHG